MNQVAKSNPHKIRCDPAIRFDIHQVGIVTSVWVIFKPNKKQGKSLFKANT